MFKLLFSPYGAINRSKFLLGLFDLIGLLIIAMFAWSFIYLIMFKVLDSTNFANAMNAIKTPPVAVAGAKVVFPAPNAAAMQTITTVSVIVFGAFYLASLWCKLCLFLKRLEDIGVSRWFAIMPFLGFGLLFVRGADAINLLGLGLIALFYMLMIFWPSSTAKA